MYYPEWVMFFDEFAEELHPTFQEELRQQLFEKGDVGTGVKQFEKYGFQLTVGMEDMQTKVLGNRVYAKVRFITPTSWSFPVDIFWTCNNEQDLLELHKIDISEKQVEINWGENFPIEKILPHIRPYRSEKKGKNGFTFDIEYYYFLLPDVSLELHFEKNLDVQDVERINTFISDFTFQWNRLKKGKELSFVSKLEKNDEKVYTIVANIGLKNSVRVIKDLLKGFSEQFENLIVEKVIIR